MLRRSNAHACATIAPRLGYDRWTFVMISFARYAALLERPGLRGTIAASVLGRLPIGITGLAILLLAQSATGSYATGGAASACYVAGLAVCAPLLGRLIDRQGPRLALLVSAALFPATLLALVAAIHAGAPLWVALGWALAAGASFPPITVCMRTLFKRQLAEDSLLAAAYSLESVLIEIIFILGPMLVAALVALASPAAAVSFAAACGCVGTVLFVRSEALRHWRIEPRRASNLFGPLTEPGFPALLGVVLCYANAFGLIEIATMAYAAERGAPALAGVLLGVMSIGSALGGIVYGSRTWRLTLPRQFALTLAVMGIGVAPLALALPFWAFVSWCIGAGIVMAPALIIQSMLVAKQSRAEHSTEAFTWSSSALLAGVGIGLAFGGQILEIARSSAVFVAAAAASLGAAILALFFLRRT